MEEKKMKLAPEQISLLKRIMSLFENALEVMDIREEHFWGEVDLVKREFYKLLTDLSEILGEDIWP